MSPWFIHAHSRESLYLIVVCLSSLLLLTLFIPTRLLSQRPNSLRSFECNSILKIFFQNSRHWRIEFVFIKPLLIFFVFFSLCHIFGTGQRLKLCVCDCVPLHFGDEGTTFPLWSSVGVASFGKSFFHLLFLKFELVLFCFVLFLFVCISFSRCRCAHLSRNHYPFFHLLAGTRWFTEFPFIKIMKQMLYKTEEYARKCVRSALNYFSYLNCRFRV